MVKGSENHFTILCWACERALQKTAKRSFDLFHPFPTLQAYTPLQSPALGSLLSLSLLRQPDSLDRRSAFFEGAGGTLLRQNAVSCYVNRYFP